MSEHGLFKIVEDISLKNSNILKAAAIFFMLIDHIGAILYPNFIILRVIGRIAFPIFLFQSLVSTFKTKNFEKYILRLLVFGCISQIPYMIAFNKHLFQLNIFFTLALISLYFRLFSNGKYLQSLILLPLFFFVEYDYYALLIGFCFYLFGLSIYSFLTFFTINLILAPVYSSIQVFSFLSFFVFWLVLNSNIFKNIDIRLNKLFFYLFYPIHLLILILIKYTMF